MDVRDNMEFLLYLDGCSLLFQHYTAFPVATATGILQACYKILVRGPFYLCISGWPLLRSFRSLRGKCLTPSEFHPPPSPCLNGFSLQHYHSCDTSKPVAGVAGHVIPKSASVTKGTSTGDLQWQVSYLMVSFSWMTWLIKFNVEQEHAYILPGLRCSYSHLT